jgi:hypothetical protein
MTCSCTTLYWITDGRRVFLVEAQSPEDLEAERQPSRRNSSSHRPRKDKGPHKIEYRQPALMPCATGEARRGFPAPLSRLGRGAGGEGERLTPDS